MVDRRRGARPPEGYRASDHPPSAVTVDVVILTVREGALQVLLVERSADPFAGSWALPGGFKLPDETLDEAAARELREETGVGARRLVQLGAYGDPGRDPRMNVVTVAYLAVVADVGEVVAGSDAADAALWPTTEVVEGRLELAFDHRRIVTDAVDRVRTELETSNLAAAFVADEFTISELRAVYEAVWETSFDPANFRRSFLTERLLVPTGRRGRPGSEGGRPPELYQSSAAWETASPLRRPRPGRSAASAPAPPPTRSRSAPGRRAGGSR